MAYIDQPDGNQQAGGNHQPQGGIDGEYPAADQGQEDKGWKSDYGGVRRMNCMSNKFINDSWECYAWSII